LLRADTIIIGIRKSRGKSEEIGEKIVGIGEELREERLLQRA
jgi:hypothetical protein